jgi:CheY-like chemotaxis protein
MRLLVVDDNEVFRQELSDLLEQDGHQATSAASVPKALEAIDSGDFDLIFTDLKMPRHGGLELLAEVRRRWPRVLVVIITGFATVGTAVEAMKLGAFDYLTKPFQIAQLQRVLAGAEDERRFQGQASSPATVEHVARRWSSGGLSVLWVSDAPAPPVPHVTAVPVPKEPALVRDAVEVFLPGNPRPGVILDGVDRLFHKNRRGEFVRFVTGLSERLKGHGPLVVTFDPRHVTEAEAEDLRSVLAGPLTGSTLEALSNPIRRAVMRRAAEGPMTFSEGLRAAGIDDSPKLSFHLHRLVDDGLLGRQGDEYRITERGRDSLRLLAQWDSVSSESLSASAAFPVAQG